MKFNLFHLTTKEAAEQILDGGFRPDEEQEETLYSPANFVGNPPPSRGVWLSDRPLEDPGGRRTECLSVELYLDDEDADITRYEVVSNPPKRHREWVIPASVVNENAVVSPPERKRAARPPNLTDDDEFNLKLYLHCSLIVHGLTSDDADAREGQVAALRGSGLDLDEVVRLHHMDHKEAVALVLRGMVDANVSDETVATCARLFADDAILSYMMELLAEQAVQDSGLTINGIAMKDIKDGRKGGRD